MVGERLENPLGVGGRAQKMKGFLDGFIVFSGFLHCTKTGWCSSQTWSQVRLSVSRNRLMVIVIDMDVTLWESFFYRKWTQIGHNRLALRWFADKPFREDPANSMLSVVESRFTGVTDLPFSPRPGRICRNSDTTAASAPTGVPPWRSSCCGYSA